MNTAVSATAAATGAGAPRILLLGPVKVEGAIDGLVEPSRRNRLTELAAILATNPGCDHTVIDACYSPGERVGDNARNTQISKLRRWLGRDANGDDYLPRYHEADASYQFHAAVTTDWDQFQQLLAAGPVAASTEDLTQALALVRGRPFDRVRARRYIWADRLKGQMIAAIVEAAYELARRRLMAGDWQAAEAATVLGLSIEPGVERLWRVRILAAHASSNPVAVQEAIDRLMVITDQIGGGIEPATQELIDQLAARIRLTRVPHANPAPTEPTLDMVDQLSQRPTSQ